MKAVTRITTMGWVQKTLGETTPPEKTLKIYLKLKLLTKKTYEKKS
jgi:hypothetical protein